jgi:hypothetical protein
MRALSLAIDAGTPALPPPAPLVGEGQGDLSARERGCDETLVRLAASVADIRRRVDALRGRLGLDPRGGR